MGELAHVRQSPGWDASIGTTATAQKADRWPGPRANASATKPRVESTTRHEMTLHRNASTTRFELDSEVCGANHELNEV